MERPHVHFGLVLSSLVGSLARSFSVSSQFPFWDYYALRKEIWGCEWKLHGNIFKVRFPSAILSPGFGGRTLALVNFWSHIDYGVDWGCTGDTMGYCSIYNQHCLIWYPTIWYLFSCLIFLIWSMVFVMVCLYIMVYIYRACIYHIYIYIGTYLHARSPWPLAGPWPWPWPRSRQEKHRGRSSSTAAGPGVECSLWHCGN